MNIKNYQSNFEFNSDIENIVLDGLNLQSKKSQKFDFYYSSA